MELRDITPKSLNCGIGACHAIFEAQSGTYVLIGRRVPRSVEEELRGRIGIDEVAIEIPRELLSNIKR
jgi:hypothetical protein